MDRRCLIVVPCYNEAGRLDPEIWLSFAEQHPNIGFLFMNDGSTDGTEAILDSLHERLPTAFERYSTSVNRGKAEAVRHGMLWGLTRPVDYVGYWDADLATPLETISTFINFLDDHPRFDLIMGSRIQLLGHVIQRSAIRHVLGRVFAFAAARTLGMTVYDTQCGAKLFRATRGVELVFADPFRTNWTFDVEVLSRLSFLKLQYRDGEAPLLYEYPLPEWRDVAGSKVQPADFFRAFGGLLTIFFSARHNHRFVDALEPIDCQRRAHATSRV